MKVGLVLGAGGIQGGAWLTGGLAALAEETGWDPAGADYVVGTSAGSMIGALCASGVPTWFMVAHSRGEVFEGVMDADGRPAADADRAAGARFELVRALPPIGPGSWRLAFRTLANPRRFTPATVFTGWIPRGIFSTESLKETIHRVVPTGWSPTRTSGSSPATTRPAAGSHSVAPTLPPPTSPTPSPPPARSPASTTP